MLGSATSTRGGCGRRRSHSRLCSRPWLFAALLSIAQGAAGFSVTIDSSNCTATIFRASLSAFEASTPGAHFSYYYGTPYNPTPATLQPVSLFGAPKRTRTFVIYWADGLFDSNTSFPLTFDVRNATGQVLRIPDSSELDVQTKQVAVTCKLGSSSTSTSRFGAFTTVAASFTATLSTADQTLAALPSTSSMAATLAPLPVSTTTLTTPSSTATQVKSESAPQKRVPTLVGAIVGSILGAALLALLLLLLCVRLRERNASQYQQRREERHGRSHSGAALFGVRGEGEEEEGNGQTQDEAVWTKEDMENADANSPEKPSSAPSTPQLKRLGAFLPAWLAALAANRREMRGALRPPSVNPFETTRSWQASMADAHAQAQAHHDGGGGSSVQLPDGPLFRNPYPILNSTPKFPAAPTPSNARVAQAEEDVDAKSSNRSEYARRFAAAAALASQLAMLLSTHARHARGSLRRRRVALRWDDQVRKDDGRGRSGVGKRRDGGLDTRGMEEVEKMAGEMTRPYSAVETQSWSQCHSAELASIVRPSSQPLSWAAGTGTFPLVKTTSSPLLDTRQGAAAISPASQQWTARYIPAGRAHSAGASGGSGGGAAAAAFYARSPVSSSANFPQLAPSSSNGLHPGPRLASSAATGSHQSGRPAVYHSPPPTVPLRLGYGASAGRFLEVGPALESILSVTSEGTEDTAASAGAARSRIEEEETEAQEDLALVTSAATKMETSAAEPLTRPSSAASNSSQSRYGMIRIKERPTSAASGGGSGSGCGSGSGSGSGASALRQSALTSVASPSVSPTPTLTSSQPLFTRTRSVVGPRPLTTSPSTGTTPPATATQTTSEAPGAQNLRTEAAVPAVSQQMKTVGARRGMSIPLPAVSLPKAATAAAAAAATSTPAMASATALAAAMASASPLSTPLHQYTAEELQAHLLLSGWVIQGEPSPLPQPQPPSGQHP